MPQSRAPAVLTEDVERERRGSVLQRLKVEVLADAGDHGVVTHMSRPRLLDVDAELLLSLAVEDHHTVLGVLVGRKEIASLHYLYPHKFEEVIRNRVALEVDILIVVSSAPAHSSSRYQVSVSPGDVLHQGTALQTCLEGLVRTPVPGERRLNISTIQLLLVEAHIVGHHIAVLQLDENRADDEGCRNHELHPDQQSAQPAAGSREAEIALESQRRLERSDIKRRIDAAGRCRGQCDRDCQAKYSEVVSRKGGGRQEAVQ